MKNLIIVFVLFLLFSCASNNSGKLKEDVYLQNKKEISALEDIYYISFWHFMHLEHKNHYAYYKYNSSIKTIDILTKNVISEIERIQKHLDKFYITDKEPIRYNRKDVELKKLGDSIHKLENVFDTFRLSNQGYLNQVQRIKAFHQKLNKSDDLKKLIYLQMLHKRIYILMSDLYEEIANIKKRDYPGEYIAIAKTSVLDCKIEDSVIAQVLPVYKLKSNRITAKVEGLDDIESIDGTGYFSFVPEKKEVNKKILI
jgi:hypothetical protein